MPKLEFSPWLVREQDYARWRVGEMERERERAEVPEISETWQPSVGGCCHYCMAPLKTIGADPRYCDSACAEKHRDLLGCW